MEAERKRARGSLRLSGRACPQDSNLRPTDQARRHRESSQATKPDESACTLVQSEKFRAVAAVRPALVVPSEIMDEATGEVLDVVQDNDPDLPPESDVPVNKPVLLARTKLQGLRPALIG